MGEQPGIARAGACRGRVVRLIGAKAAGRKLRHRRSRNDLHIPGRSAGRAFIDQPDIETAPIGVHAEFATRDKRPFASAAGAKTPQRRYTVLVDFPSFHAVRAPPFPFGGRGRAPRKQRANSRPAGGPCRSGPRKRAQAPLENRDSCSILSEASAAGKRQKNRPYPGFVNSLTKPAE